MITALAVILSRRGRGRRRWTAIAVGFIGTLLIVKPAPANFNACALLASRPRSRPRAADMITRKLSTAIPTVAISFMAAFGTVDLRRRHGTVRGVGGPMSALRCRSAWRSPRCFVAAGHFLIVIAFRGVDVSAIAPFRYTLLIWAGICGYLASARCPTVRDLRRRADRRQRSLRAAPRGRTPPDACGGRATGRARRLSAGPTRDGAQHQISIDASHA